MKSKTKISRICVILLALMMCTSGIIMSPVAGEDMGDENNVVNSTNVEGSTEAKGDSVEGINPGTSTSHDGEHQDGQAKDKNGIINSDIRNFADDETNTDPSKEKNNEKDKDKVLPKDKNKSNLIEKSITCTVTQSGKTLTDIKDGEERIIDPNKPFDVTIKFKFPIIKNKNIGTPLANGIKLPKDQIDEGDFAFFELGKHFIVDKKNHKIPVRIVAENNPDNHKHVGDITINTSEDPKKKDTLVARMDFGSNKEDYYGKYDYECESRRDITVQFTGKFKVDPQAFNNQDPNKRIIKIFDKEYKLPDLKDNTYYSFYKSGKLDSEKTKDSITWNCNIRKVSNNGSKPLGGEVFSDELNGVGEYLPGTLKIFGKDGKELEGIDYKSIYDQATNTIKFVFPQDFKDDTARITFQTRVSQDVKDDNKAVVTNTAKLKISDKIEKSAETTVQVHNPLEIEKNFQGVGINKNKEREVIWTIVAGASNEDYGPVWIGDILKGLKGQKKPKRVDLSYEHRDSNDPNDNWKPVGENNVKRIPDDVVFPGFPQKNGKCPDLSEYTKAEIYELGRDKFTPTKSPDKVDEKEKYELLESNWIFLPRLKGIYRITVKLIYDEKETKIGNLKNDAEIHTCHEVVYPTKEPPIYDGLGTIVKGFNSDDKDSIRKGNLPWKITVDFSKVFPSDKRFVYECFYYGDKEQFDKEKDNLNLGNDTTLSEDVFKYLINGEEENTYFNFNQAYIAKSVKSEIKKAEKSEKKDSQDGKIENGDSNTGNAEEGNKPNANPSGSEKIKEPEKEPLSDKIIYVYNAAGDKVGEIVKISGFSDMKKYEFTIKTRPQDIIENLKNNPSSINSKSYGNTAVLAVGEGDTFKTISSNYSGYSSVKLIGKSAIGSKTKFDVEVEKNEDNNKASADTKKRKIFTNIYQGSTFDYTNDSILFRIDVNPQGFNIQDYISNLSGKKPNGDYKKLEVVDTLQDGLSLASIEGTGQDYYIYKAKPCSPGSTSEPIERLDSVNGLNFSKSKDSKGQNTLSWTFDNYNGESYIILIRVKVESEYFKKIMGASKQWHSSIPFRNDVNLKVNGIDFAKASDSVYVSNKLLKKHAPMQDEKNTQLKWTFIYEPLGIKYKNIDFKDELDKNITLPIDNKGNIDLSNFKVVRTNLLKEDGTYGGPWEDVPVKLGHYKPNGNYVNVSYDKSTHIISFKIPDSGATYSYKFTYPTVLKASDTSAPSIQNTVKLYSDGKPTGAEGYSDIKTQNYKAFATIDDHPSLVIKKVDENEKPLAGAVFEYTNVYGEKIVSQSDEEGYVYIVNLKKDELTKVKETKAPDGYDMLNQDIELDVDQTGKVTVKLPTGLKGEGTKENPIIVKNSKTSITYINIPVTKKWAGDKDEDRPESITVKLIANGKYTNKSLKLSKANGWNGEFKYLPLTAEYGSFIKYEVVEEKVKGYKTSIHGNKYIGFTITNTKPDKPYEPGEPGTPENPNENPGKPGEPGNPDNPSGKPGENGNPNGKGNPKAPSTGDNDLDYAWSVMAAAAALGVVYIKRKKEYSE